MNHLVFALTLLLACQLAPFYVSAQQVIDPHLGLHDLHAPTCAVCTGIVAVPWIVIDIISDRRASKAHRLKKRDRKQQVSTASYFRYDFAALHRELDLVQPGTP